MNTAPTPKAQVPDIAAQITYAMRTMGVAPIPRNYELFYEAYIGSNPTLTKELAALGSKATQDELDELGRQYFGNHQSQVIENAHSKLIAELDGLLRVLQQEQTSLVSYNKLLGETYTRISSKSHTSADILRSAINILSEATGDTMAHGEKTVEKVSQKSQEMDQVRKELDEYKRIANTDSLTRIANRRAFDERLAAIYDSGTSAPLTGLVLADIDNFKKINDTYGHPVGDKILATVATVIRANVRKDCFVARTGGEEFAVIVDGNTAEEVNQMCERIRTALETTPFKNSKTGVNYGPITLSLGFCMAGDAEDPGELYAKSDIALYCAKNAGRNRTKIYEDGMKKDFTKSWLIYKR
ncbi:GGDEF domain-containing protein [Rhizobium sp. S-51]|jgi:diguanylate cyclase|uniref:diguanylate cyclase n=1 Tax=Rhizobium terricola TaxID=2728849 RepID=A0A7Y0ATS6_9HYPH|nr:GGDEF domain-containing protein [Rhizobium terricola]NML73314.1 GGDEF domain-containing protein [Rhizobium terricola]